MKIIVDTRESNKEFVSYFINEAEKRGYEIEKKALMFGDIKCGDLILERKQIDDLVSSITSPRMWEQIRKMKENPDYVSMILVSGTIESMDFRNKSKIREMYGGIIKVMRLGIPVHFLDNDIALTNRALDLFEHSTDIDIPIKKVKKINGLSIIRGFPSVGQKTMEYIKNKFPTVQDFLLFVTHAEEKDLQNAFGKAKGTTIFNAIREKL